MVAVLKKKGLYMEIRYLQNGEEVVLVDKVQNGYLIKRIYSCDGTDEEGDIEYVEKIYNTPPTEKLSFDISKLKMEKLALEAQIKELQKSKLEEQKYLGKINKIPHFQMIIDYFSNEYRWVLTQNNQIREASTVFNSHNVSIELVGGELRLYTLRNKIFGSEKTWVSVYKNKEEALTERRRRVLDIIKSTELEGKLDEIVENYDDLVEEVDIKTLIENRKIELRNNEKAKIIEDARIKIEKYTKILNNNN